MFRALLRLSLPAPLPAIRVQRRVVVARMHHAWAVQKWPPPPLLRLLRLVDGTVGGTTYLLTSLVRGALGAFGHGFLRCCYSMSCVRGDCYRRGRPPFTGCLRTRFRPRFRPRFRQAMPESVPAFPVTVVQWFVS